MVQVVIKAMYLPGSWERGDMLPQNTLQQVTFVRCIYSALYYSHEGTKTESMVLCDDSELSVHSL
jgi:hypothetical protein